MKSIKLYPPHKGDPITPHPSDIEFLKSQGWTEKPKESSTKQPEKERVK